MRKFSTGAQGEKNLPVLAVFTIIAISFFLISSSASAQGRGSNSSSSHESERAAQVRALNNSVLQLHGQMQENASGRSAIRGQAAPVFAQRAATLQALIQEDPHAALTFAFSPELLADLAAKFPDSTSLLESHVTLNGSIEHWIADSADMKSSRESWYLNAGGSRLSLYFATPQRPGPNSGPTVTIEGVQVGSAVAVSKLSSATSGATALVPQTLGFLSGQRLIVLVLLLVVLAFVAARKLAVRPTPSLTPALLRQVAVCCLALAVVIINPIGASAQTCGTTGIQNYLIVMVNLPGLNLPSTVTSSSLSTLFFGAAPSVANYVSEVSSGKASLAGTVVGPYTLTGSYTCSNWFSGIAQDAIAAAVNAGVDMNGYSRVFVVAPDLSPSCGFAALSTVGCQSVTTSAGTFHVSYTTAFPDYLFNYHGVYVAAHDGVGHQLGLAHSKLRQYTDSTGTAIPLGALSDTGTITEYGDHYAVMGTYNQGHFAAAHQADWLNWMSAGTDYETVTASGTYTIQPIEKTSGLRALKVQRGTGNSGYYLWIEYRQSLGDYDSTYATLGPYVTQAYQGAYIHYEDATTGQATHLLDFTAPAAYSENPALAAGQTWTDPYSDLSISVQNVTSAGLTVGISYSGSSSSCATSAPTVNASPLNPSIYAGQTASYSVSVTNNDSSGCAASTINLGSSEPSGWSTSFSSPSVVLSPGQSVSLTMGKGAPSSTPAGTYAVDLTAANSQSTVTDMANATVVTPPSLAVSVSISGASFVRPGTVPITASVTNGGTAASGASVNFTLTTPTGSTVTQSVTTGSNGTATWNYKLNSKSATGTYSVAAQATLGSGGSGGRKNAASTQTSTASSNTATFSVQ
jgi:hypothetical protein